MTRFFTVFLLISLVFSNLSVANKIEEVDLSFDFYTFAVKRIPNAGEVLIDASSLSILDALLQDYVVKLKKDPASGAVLRDAMKIIPTISKAYHSIQVGGTEHTYDFYNVHSQLVKVLAKLSQIYSLTKYGLEADTAGHIANYGSDVLSRAIILAGQEWQKAKTNLSFEEYFFIHFKSHWFGSAVVEATPKVAFNDVLSYFLIKKTGTYDYILGKMFGGINYLFPAIKQDHKKSFWSNAQQNILPGSSYLRRAGIHIFNFTSSVVSYFAFNTIVTYALTPPARIIMDGLGHFQKYCQNLWKTSQKSEL